MKSGALTEVARETIKRMGYGPLVILPLPRRRECLDRYLDIPGPRFLVVSWHRHCRWMDGNFGGKTCRVYGLWILDGAWRGLSPSLR